MKQLYITIIAMVFSVFACAQTPDFVVKYPDDLDSLNIGPLAWEYFDMQIFDADGDGDMDMVYPTYWSGLDRLFYNTLYLNDGVGGMNYSGATTQLSTESVVTASADINNDGFIDLIQVCSSCSRDTLLFSTNSGLGYFNLDSNLVAGIGLWNGLDGIRFTFLDSDNDGDEDLLFAYTDYSQNISGQGIYKNDGLGHFTKDTTAFMEVTYDYAPGVADFNQDGYVDLAFIDDNNTNNDTLKIFLNDGTGGFSTPIATFWVGASYNILVFDANGDGKQDIAAYGQTFTFGPHHSFLFINEGNGVFNPQNTLGLEPGSTGEMGLNAADFDLDGDQDLVYKGGSNGIEIYLNDGTGDFYRDSASLIFDESYTYIPGGDTDIQVADMDNDGDTDIIIGHHGYRPVILFNERILTGVDEQAAMQSIQLYPNPAQNTLQLNGVEEPCNYSIYTLQGRLVQTGRVNPGEGIEVARLTKGMYVFQLETGERVKFVKE